MTNQNELPRFFVKKIMLQYFFLSATEIDSKF